MKWCVALLLLACGSAQASNYPCSGKKGGIAHCLGQYFVCNDGSTSQSKKDCRTYPGGHNKSDGPAADPKPKKGKP